MKSQIKQPLWLQCNFSDSWKTHWIRVLCVGHIIFFCVFGSVCSISSDVFLFLFRFFLEKYKGKLNFYSFFICFFCLFVLNKLKKIVFVCVSIVLTHLSYSHRRTTDTHARLHTINVHTCTHTNCSIVHTKFNQSITLNQPYLCVEKKSTEKNAFNLSQSCPLFICHFNSNLPIKIV